MQRICPREGSGWKARAVEKSKSIGGKHISIREE
jgi:hypothetical protein